VGASPIAHGVDLVEVRTFSGLFEGDAAIHLSRYFTPGELVSIGIDSRSADRMSGRFAIKEAVLKALGTGWGDSIGFKDIEIVTSEIGAPSVVLHRRLHAIATELGITRWLVSSAHAGGFVMASVIGV